MTRGKKKSGLKVEILLPLWKHDVCESAYYNAWNLGTRYISIEYNLSIDTLS